MHQHKHPHDLPYQRSMLRAFVDLHAGSESMIHYHIVVGGSCCVCKIIGNHPHWRSATPGLAARRGGTLELLAPGRRRTELRSCVGGRHLLARLGGRRPLTCGQELEVFWTYLR